MSLFDDQTHSDLAAKVTFIGSMARFSDRMLSIFREEFTTHRFERFNTVSDFEAADDQAEPVEVLILDDSHIASVVNDPSAYLSLVEGAQLAIAFHQTAKAMHFLECRGRDASLSSVGLLPLNTQIEVWISIMRLLMCRQIFLPQAIVLGLDSKECGTNDTATRAMILAEQSDCNLTVREWEVLELVASGLQNKMIAASLKLSEHTVKLHIHKVLRKLGVSNRTLATRWFHQVANGPTSIDGQPHA